MDKTDKKLNVCIGILVLVLAGTAWADYMLARVDSRVSIQRIPVSTRWIDKDGLEQTFVTYPEPGEPNDILYARHKDAVAEALKFFPCKEQIR